MVRWQRDQLRQTVIATGVVGAAVGVLPWVGMLVLGAGSRMGAVHARPWLAQLLDAGLFVLMCVVCCVVVFGLLPMALQYAFICGMRWWTGRD